MTKKFVGRLFCSITYVALAVIPAKADTIVFRGTPHAFAGESGGTGSNPGTNPGGDPGNGTNPQTPSELVVPAPSGSLQIASGANWNVVVTPTGGKGPYTFDVAGLPNTIAMEDNGVRLLLKGVAASGIYPGIKVGVTDSTGISKEGQPFSVTVAQAPLVVPAPSSASLQIASGASWNIVVTPTGGKAPYSFDVTGAPTEIQQEKGTSTLKLTGVAPAGTYAGIKVAVSDAVGTRVEGAAFTVVVAEDEPVASAHKFWRVLISGNRNPMDSGNGYTGLREVEMIDESGSDATTGGTAFASSIYSSGYQATAAFDNLDATSWYSVAGSPLSASSTQHIGYEFASPVDVKTVTIKASSDLSSIPRDFVVQWSDNGTSYTTSATYMATDLTNNVKQSFAAVRAPIARNADQHHYWRVAVTKSRSDRKAYMNEIVFHSGSTVLPVSSGGLTIGNGKNNVGLAFDGDVSTYTPAADIPAYYGYGFTTPVAVSHIGLIPYADGYEPVDIQIQWSDDGSSWSNPVSHLNLPTWTNRDPREYSTTVGTVN
jgi:hypothetical protein